MLHNRLPNVIRRTEYSNTQLQPMDLDLEQIHPWESFSHSSDPRGRLSGRLILCTEAPRAWSGRFALAALVLQALKGGGIEERSVFLVCTKHERLHYDLLLRKKGIDMASQESTGAIKVVLLEAEDADCWGSTMPPLLHMLRASPGVVLFLADLDVLEALSPDTSACRQFVAELYDMLDSKQLNTVVAFGRLTEELDDGCPQVVQRFLTNTCTQNKNITATEYLRFRADLIISILPLLSGYSMMADGLIRVSEGLSERLYVYKSVDASSGATKGSIKCQEVGK